MAVYLAVRVIIYAGGAARVVKYEQSASGQPGPLDAAQWLWERLNDPGESDEDLTAAVEEWSGTMADVATYSEPFELRKMHIEWIVNSNDVAGEDVRVCTFHFLKLAAGVPQSDWTNANFLAVDNAAATWWDAIKIYYPSTVQTNQVKFYKAGPDIEPPQVPVYTRSWLGAVGTGSGSMLPPQVAVTVTEKAGSKAHWGRFYLPAPAALSTVLGSTGRLHATFQDAVATATDTWYETCKTAGLLPVVYRPPLPVRQTAAEKRAGTTPGSLPARDGSAWSIDSLTVDNVFDVMRSRRYDRPTSRSDRAIA